MSIIKEMCTQDVIEYHCPCFGVGGEIHPCRAIQSRPPGYCLGIRRRTLKLPQKCSYCRSKSIAKRTAEREVEPVREVRRRWKAMKEGVAFEKENRKKAEVGFREGVLEDEEFGEGEVWIDDDIPTMEDAMMGLGLVVDDTWSKRPPSRRISRIESGNEAAEHITVEHGEDVALAKV